jgi:hypothetical protein
MILPPEKNIIEEAMHQLYCYGLLTHRDIKKINKRLNKLKKLLNKSK